MPLTIVIAITAVYAMYLRLDAFGFTVTRVWGLVVAVAACIYSVGYGLAARHGDHWMASIARINVAAAVFLIVVLSLTLTPLLSPYRIAASSQFRFAQATPEARAPQNAAAESPLHYLHFKAGQYGIDKLEQLMTLQNHPRAEEIRRAAKAMREQKDPRTPANIQTLLANLRLPAGGELDPKLRDAIATDMKNSSWQHGADVPAIGGAFVDLNRDQQQEFVLVYGSQIFAYTNSGTASWRRAGQLIPPREPLRGEWILQKLIAGDVQARDPQWQELQLGDTVLRLTGP